MENDSQPTITATSSRKVATLVKVLDKADVKRVKSLLEAQGVYNNREKIRFDSVLGCFLLPVIISLNCSNNSAGESLEKVDIGGEWIQLAGVSFVDSSDNNVTKAEPPVSAATSNGGLRPVVNEILAEDISISSDTRALMVLSISTKYSVYPPLVLFNYGMFGAKGSAGANAWHTYLEEPARSARFFQTLLERFFNQRTAVKKRTNEINGGAALTHVAENWPIPDKADILRLPSRILQLYPAPLTSLSENDNNNTSTENHSCGNDMEELWCTVTQNGIKQTWAPKHTMFSRGNIKEKARVLQLASMPAVGTEAGTDNSESRTMAVDLYAGIGYFTFSYAASRRVRTVLCWELNPWSIKGLIRGTILNKWHPISVQHLNSADEALDRELRELEQYFVFAAADTSKSQAAKENVTPATLKKSKKQRDCSDVNIIIFAEDNIHAFDRVQTILGQNKPLEGVDDDGDMLASSECREPKKRPLISHINMGLLPHAHLAYPVAIQIALLSGLPSVALHVHENVAVTDFDAWITRTTAALQRLVDQDEYSTSVNEKHKIQIDFTHLEKIKTYAPGVWHVCGDFNVVKGFVIHR